MQNSIAFYKNGWYKNEYEKEEGVCHYEDTGRIDRWF